MAGHDYLHDVAVASQFGMLGSVDANTGSPDLGWDTDQFPMDIKNCTLLMKVCIFLKIFSVLKTSNFDFFDQIIIDQGGLTPGGLNFDCKVRRESIDIRDMFVAHIGIYAVTAFITNILCTFFYLRCHGRFGQRPSKCC